MYSALICAAMMGPPVVSQDVQTLPVSWEGGLVVTQVQFIPFDHGKGKLLGASLYMDMEQSWHLSSTFGGCEKTPPWPVSTLLTSGFGGAPAVGLFAFGTGTGIIDFRGREVVEGAAYGVGVSWFKAEGPVDVLVVADDPQFTVQGNATFQQGGNPSPCNTCTHTIEHVTLEMRFTLVFTYEPAVKGPTS